MKIKNPCKGQCYDVSSTRDLCLACGLRISERPLWPSLSDEGKRKILERIKRKRGGNPAG